MNHYEISPLMLESDFEFTHRPSVDRIAFPEPQALLALRPEVHRKALLADRAGWDRDGRRDDSPPQEVRQVFPEAGVPGFRDWI